MVFINRKEQPSISDAVAARVRELRVARDWTQEQLADNAKLSKDTISHIERGDRKTRLDTLVQIANAFGLPLPEVLDVGEMLPRNRISRRHARLLRESLAQLPPWLADAVAYALGTIAQAARKVERRRTHGRTKPVS